MSVRSDASIELQDITALLAAAGDRAPFHTRRRVREALEQMGVVEYAEHAPFKAPISKGMKTIVDRALPDLCGRFTIDPYTLNEMVEAYYAKPGNVTGGYLHIVLDDDNVEGRHVLWCLHEAERARDWDGVFIAEALLELDYSERECLVSGGYKR